MSLKKLASKRKQYKVIERNAHIQEQHERRRSDSYNKNIYENNTFYKSLKTKKTRLRRNNNKQKRKIISQTCINYSNRIANRFGETL